MKKFLIISTALILVSCTVFGFSLHNYIKKTHVEETIAPPQKVDNTTPTLGQIDAPSQNAAMPTSWQDDGIFSKHYDKAYSYVLSMSTEQMVGQMLLGTCPTDDTAKTNVTKYALGGYLYSTDNFYGKSMEEIKTLISTNKTAGTTPIISAVKEEGGAVTTLSDLDAYYEYSFASPRNTFAQGGMEAIKADEEQKATMLASSGIDLNLAPVCDMGEEMNHIMYSRSLGGTVEETCEFATTVTNTSQTKGVSVALKHFPGYGTNLDTVEPVVVDTREVSVFEQNDFKPFEAGINAGAHCVMMSNVLAQNLDANCISSLSPYMHEVLRNRMGFTGLIITDNLDNADYSQYSNGKNVYVQAVLAGNDMILVNNVDAAYTAILEAVNNGTIDVEDLQKVCTRIIAYKYAAGIMK